MSNQWQNFNFWVNHLIIKSFQIKLNKPAWPKSNGTDGVTSQLTLSSLEQYGLEKVSV